MGQFIAPRGQQLPVTIADVKNRIRRAEHKIEALQAQGSDTGGIEVTFSASLPDSANVGDIWYQTSGDSVIASYQCATAYASGDGVQGDWTAYTTSGVALTAGTVTSTEIAAEGVSQANLSSDITARTLGGTIVTIGETEPTGAVNGDTWIETDSSNNITSIWTYNGGAWVESTIAISTSTGVEITASTTAPANPNVNDMWINESAGNVLEQWDGSEWNPYQFGTSALQGQSVTAAILGEGSVTQSSIQAGALNSVSVSNPNIQGGTITAADVILQPGSSNAILAYATPTPSATITFTTAGTYTWLCPTGVTSIVVSCWGAGGGGGGAGGPVGGGAETGGAGGGGGEFASQTLTVVPGTTYTFVVGAGGNAGGAQVSGGGVGPTAGGNSTFTVGSTVVTAHGGAAGGSGVGATSVGGAGGTGSTNTTHFAGGAGGSTSHPQGAGGGGSAGTGSAGNAGNNVSSTLGSLSGQGGASVPNGGIGGNGSINSANGGNGYPPGGGGGGGAFNSTANTASAGGAGAPGQVRISYTAAQGTPSIGASVSAVSNTDQYGSAYVDGFTSYSGTAKMQLHVNTSNSAPALEIYTGIGSELVHPAIYALSGNVGAVNEYEWLTISGPGSSYDGTQTNIFLVSSTKNGSAGPYVEFAIGGLNPLLIDETGVHVETMLYGTGGYIICGDKLTAQEPGASPNNPEVWHTITLDSGWSTNSSHPVPQYRLLPDGNVQIIGYASHATLTGTTSLNSGNPLPAAYRPATEPYFCGDVNRGAFEITTTGIIQMLATSGLNLTQIEMHAIYPAGL